MDKRLCDDALAVLAELVACEDLKATLAPDDDTDAYERRCLPAWIAARTILKRAEARK